jgi:hypothetical protein
LTQLSIALPDETEYFLREIIGYEDEDFEAEFLGSLQMTIDDMLSHFKLFRAAEEAEAALDRRINVIMAMTREPTVKLQEKILISPSIRAAKEASQR